MKNTGEFSVKKTNKQKNNTKNDKSRMGQMAENKKTRQKE